VGAVERTRLLPRDDISPGDILLGLPSTGLHSNGFSLVRAVLARAFSATTTAAHPHSHLYSSPCPWDSTTTLGQALLTPTAIYAREILPAARAGLIKAMAHITGGGFVDNVPRALPKSLGARIDVGKWSLPPVFRWLIRAGEIAPSEMVRTFNCGVGMVLVVSRDEVGAAMQTLRDAGQKEVYTVGEVVGSPGIEVVNVELWKE
jgi:phosphoribosylamine--glycine ligase / phosphoribosylformylglycinamidine cyclo-ligase